jgi:hypothetical protein
MPRNDILERDISRIVHDYGQSADSCIVGDCPKLADIRRDTRRARISFPDMPCISVIIVSAGSLYSTCYLKSD